jgi:FlgD Ig-like domain
MPIMRKAGVLAILVATLLQSAPLYAQHTGLGSGSESSPIENPVVNPTVITSGPGFIGPQFPPPGTETYVPSGPGAGLPGGTTWSHSAVSVATTTNVYWGPEANEIKMSFDGNSYSGGEVMSFSLANSNLAGGVAVWEGVSQFIGNPTPVYTRFTLTVTQQISGTPLALVQAAGPGVLGSAGVVLSVPSGLAYDANLYLEASFTNGAGYSAARLFYNAFNNGTGTNLFSSITAGFWYAPFNITPSAGLGGSIAPSSVASLAYGATSATYTFPANLGYFLSDVVLDGSTSLGPVASYAFTNVTADHTIAAVFTSYATTDAVAAVSDSCITPGHPCEMVDMLFSRLDATPARGYSVTFHLSPELVLCDTPAASITKGPYLTAAAGINGTVFQVVSNGGGSYTVDEAILGTPCGAIGSGVIFRVRVTNSGGDGIGTITVDAVTARDCSNNTIPGAPGLPTSVAIANTPPTAVADLAAAQLLTGNDTDGTTKIQLTFTGSPGATHKVYRAGFGNYPEYDDAPGSGSVPATPSYPPGAPWVLTGVTASGQYDEVLNRDYWYFVEFEVDSCGNVSSVSNKTTGTLNYHLGDVSTGFVTCAGNNTVYSEDISFLGANYAITIGDPDVLGCLDVGPTTTNYVDGRPLTDNKVQFEDLILFAINYNEVSKASPVSRPPAASDELTVLVPPASERNSEFSARLWLSGTGRVQGLSTQLRWNGAAVQPLAVEPGELLNSLGGVAFQSAPGGVDAALLGVRRVGLSGEGVLAEVRFRVVGTGDPAITIASVDARDARNQLVNMQPGGPTDVVTALPGASRLLPNAPNPFYTSTRIGFTLAADGPVEVAIYSVTGRLVRSLVHAAQTAGPHEVTWDGNDDQGARAAAGMYYVRLRAGAATSKRSIVMVR